MHKVPKHQSGFILLTILLTSAFLMVMGLVSLQLITNNVRMAKRDQHRLNAQLAADAGLDEAIRQINIDGAWTGNGSQQTLMNQNNVRTTYQTTVTNGATAYQKFVNVTAYSYFPASSTTPQFTRKYQTELQGIGGGNYSIVSGVGGLILKNNARIIDGRVFSNGTIRIENSGQIGLDLGGIPLIPVDVKAAHQVCPSPADATYPRVCNLNENGQPITFTHPQGKIYGEVRANNQTNGSQMFYPGLVSGLVSPSPLPIHNRTAQVAAATNNMTGAAASCSLLGSRIWPANTHITGNVTVSGVCIITVEGDIWISGNLTLLNTAIIVVKPGLTTTPQIMVDGTSGVLIQDGATLNANINGTGMRFITYASAASCSPDCTSVSGVDLYNSQSIETVRIINTASAGQAEFYARWSKIRISSSGNVGSLAGQTIELTDSAAVTFGTNVSGFNGPTAWVIKSYKRTY